MITSVEVENLRGIRQGKLEALSRLTVLVGRNGSGKSSLLEASLIAASRVPAIGAGLVVQSRQQYNGARWLIHGGGGRDRPPARLAAVLLGGERIERELVWDNYLAVDVMSRALANRGAPRPYSAFRIHRRHPPLENPSNPDPTTENFSIAGMAADNQFEPFDAEGKDPKGLAFRLVQPHSTQALHDLFSMALEQGRKRDVLEHAKALVPELVDLDILTEAGVPWLALDLPGGPVPATLSGDGVLAALRIVFQLAAAEGVALIEEPEVHQHPAGLARVTLAIVTAVRLGLQVILTTHSLELIDHLIAHLTDEELNHDDFLTVTRVRLESGMLHATSSVASEVAQARAEIEEDLR
ncbi:MAG: AAA family ATPase [bacterium]|nr:AAA family ATPase [bacterium]